MDIPHDSPNDLILDRKIELILSRIDKWNDGVANVYLLEQLGFISGEGLIQFTDKDLLRYFTTNDTFLMDLYIEDHRFKISSRLYTLLEREYHLDLHLSTYKISIL